MNAFEDAFKERVRGSRGAQEAEDAYESWFRQLSDGQFKLLEMGGRRRGYLEAARYLALTEKRI